MWAIGLDIGSSSCKVLCVNDDGTVLATAKTEYKYLFPRSGWVELDPNDVWQAVVSGLAQVASPLCNSVGKPVAIGVSVSGDEVVPMAGDRAVYNVITSSDVRGGTELRRLLGALDPKEVSFVTGLPLSPKYGILRMMWIKDNMPEVYRRVTRFATWEDFVIGRLTGEYVCSSSSAARLMCFDVTGNCWYDRLVEVSQVCLDLLPVVVAPGTVVGKVNVKLVPELGAIADVPVVTAGFDQACSALGSGVTSPGRVGVGTGTMESVSFYSNTRLQTLTYAGNPSLTGAGFIYTVTNPSGGSVLRWFRDNFGPGAQSCEPGHGDLYDLLLRETPEDVSELLVLPHLAGGRVPVTDPMSLGAVLGLRLSTTRGALAKGILEGLTYELRYMIEQFCEDTDTDVVEIRAAGGGSRSDRWLQIKADILGRPVYRLEIPDASALGAAIMALTGIGRFDVPAEGADSMVRIGKSFVPNDDASVRYESYYRIYRDLYGTLRSISHRLFELASSKEGFGE